MNHYYWLMDLLVFSQPLLYSDHVREFSSGVFAEFFSYLFGGDRVDEYAHSSLYSAPTAFLRVDFDVPVDLAGGFLL